MAAGLVLPRARALVVALSYSVGDDAIQDVWSIGELLVLPGVCPCWLNSGRASRGWCNVTCVGGRPTPKAPRPRTSTHLHRLNSRALRNHH